MRKVGRNRLIVLLVILALVLSACAQTPPAAPPAQPAPPADAGAAETPDPEPAPADGGLSIGFAMPDRDQWLTYLEQAAVARAGELGIDITVQDAVNDVNAQLSHVQTFAVQQKDAIVIGIIDGAFTEALIEAAGDIPVVFVNRLPDVNHLSQGSAHFVGSQEVDAGLFQAQFFASYFAGQDTLDYVLFQGPLDHAGAIGRTAGFREGMEAAGFTLNNVFQQVANWDRAVAMDFMQTFIGTGQNFDLVVANNDEMAIGAIEALYAAGMMDIPVVGVDASPSGVASILAGEMAASVFQDPVGQGAGAIDVAVALAQGQSPELYSWIPFVLVTPDNVQEFA